MSERDTFSLVQQALKPLAFLRIPLDDGGEKLLMLQSIGVIDKTRNGATTLFLLSGQSFNLSAAETVAFDKALAAAIDEAIRQAAKDNMAAMLQARGGVVRLPGA